MKPSLSILLFVLPVFCACKMQDDKGMSQNAFRKANGGLPLKSYVDRKAYSTGKTGKEGIGWFQLSAAKEQGFRKSKKAYMQAKSFYFDSLGIYQEEDNIRKQIDNDEAWRLSTIRYYRHNESKGFVEKQKNGIPIPGTEVRLDQKGRDSVLRSWNYNW